MYLNVLTYTGGHVLECAHYLGLTPGGVYLNLNALVHSIESNVQCKLIL